MRRRRGRDRSPPLERSSWCECPGSTLTVTSERSPSSSRANIMQSSSLLPLASSSARAAAASSSWCSYTKQNNTRRGAPVRPVYCQKIGHFSAASAERRADGCSSRAMAAQRMTEARLRREENARKRQNQDFCVSVELFRPVIRMDTEILGGDNGPPGLPQIWHMYMPMSVMYTAPIVGCPSE